MNADLQTFYGFTHPPFGPAGARLIQADSRNSLVDGVVRDVLAGRSVVTIGGEAGVGKTTLVDLLAADFRENGLRVIRTSGALHSPLQLQRIIGDALGIEVAESLEPHELLRAAQSPGGGAGIILLFDDAAALSGMMFRYLWLLLELFNFGRTQLQLVLVGALGQWPGLEQPDLGGLRQAMGRRVIIRPLDDDEAEAYLDSKLRSAGGSLRRVMTDAALMELLQLADGIPGQIEAMTERVLARGYQDGRRRITVPTIQLALAGADEARRPWLSWKFAFVGGLAASVTVAAALALLRPLPAPHIAVHRDTAVAVAPPAPPPLRPAPPPAQAAPLLDAAPLAVEVPVAPASSAAHFLVSPIRVVLNYPRNHADAQALATRLTTVLQAHGMLVLGPIASSAHPAHTRIRYFFARDVDAAQTVAGSLGDLTGQQRPVQLVRRDQQTAPGTVEIALSSP